MRTFSKRYRTRLYCLEPVVPTNVRVRIIESMKEESNKWKEPFPDTLIGRRRRLSDELATELGIKHEEPYLQRNTFDHKLPCAIKKRMGSKDVPLPGARDDLERYLHKLPGHEFIDACEIFWGELQGKQRDKFARELNLIFDEEGFPYRMVDGKIMSTDIAFIGSEIVAEADELLEEHGIKGALEELRKACEDFANNRFKETILKANHALESVRKAILGVEKMKPGEQCKKVIEEVVPEHFEGFQVLLKKIMDATDALRHNAPGAGHGQGKKLRQVSPQLAELALHLNSALIIYLLSEWRAKTAPDTTA
mgnify:CR=1 FL=1